MADGASRRATLAAAVVVMAMITGCIGIPRQQLALDYYRLGNAYYGLEQYDQSMGYFIRALEIDPKLKEAEYNFFRAQIESEQYSSAIEGLQALLEQDPENVFFAETLAYALYRSGQREKALAHYGRVLERSEFRLDTIYNVALILRELEDEAGALSAIDLAYTISGPDDREIQYLYAEILYDDEKQREQALEIYREIVQDSDLAVDRVRTIAALFREAEYYVDTLQLYDRLLEEEPQDSDTLFARATLLLTHAEEPVQGIAVLEEALKAGFADQAAVSLFLQEDPLLQRSQIEALLQDYDLNTSVPEPEEEPAPALPEEEPAPTLPEEETAPTLPEEETAPALPEGETAPEIPENR